MRLATRIVLLHEGRVAADLARDAFATTNIAEVREYREAFRSEFDTEKPHA